MSLFDTWETVAVSATRPRAWNNRVLMRAYAKGNKEYRKLIVSLNLIEESGSENFILKTKGDLYAMIPDENGPLRCMGSRVLGISTAVLNDIVEKVGDDECQASVIDGAIVFPIKDDFMVR